MKRYLHSITILVVIFIFISLCAFKPADPNDPDTMREFIAEYNNYLNLSDNFEDLQSNFDDLESKVEDLENEVEELKNSVESIEQ